jgi:hypothetical protein
LLIPVYLVKVTACIYISMDGRNNARTGLSRDRRH